MVGDVIGQQRHAFPFKKDVDPVFLEEFNKALKDMKEDGFMTNLYLEYLDMDVSKPPM